MLPPVNRAFKVQAWGSSVMDAVGLAVHCFGQRGEKALGAPGEPLALLVLEYGPEVAVHTSGWPPGDQRPYGKNPMCVPRVPAKLSTRTLQCKKTL